MIEDGHAHCWRSFLSIEFGYIVFYCIVGLELWELALSYKYFHLVPSLANLALSLHPQHT